MYNCMISLKIIHIRNHYQDSLLLLKLSHLCHNHGLQILNLGNEISDKYKQVWEHELQTQIAEVHRQKPVYLLTNVV